MDKNTIVSFWYNNETLGQFAIRFNGCIVDPDNDEHSLEDTIKAVSEAHAELTAFKTWLEAAANLPAMPK
jgi:hypothetical protein